MTQVSRLPISHASPRQIRFPTVSSSSSGRLVATGSKAAAFKAGQSIVPRSVERTDSQRCVCGVGVSSVALRPSLLRSVASLRGSSPRSVLACALRTLQRAARANVFQRIAARLATSSSVASRRVPSRPSRTVSELRPASELLSRQSVASESSQSRAVASSSVKRVLQ